MVSFCDIPLSNLSQNHYGKCGLAMSRKWGNKKYLEPVLYYPNDKSCQSTKMIIKAAEVFIKNRKNNDAYRILGYSKPMKKSKEKNQSTNNYVEREWRKVYANPAPLKWKTEEEYKEYRGCLRNPKTPVGTPLRFEVDDIDFILVDKKNLARLQSFIMKQLKHIGGSETDVSNEERWKLLSKILVYEDLLHNL